MPELIQQFTQQYIDKNGATYLINVYGECRDGSTWEGWIEFHPVDRSRALLKTERETTQPDRSALQYWASGLEPLYFDGAFERARQAAR